MTSNAVPTDALIADQAVLYLRVSTKDQAERGGEAEGFSIPAQREAGKRKAAQLAATVIAEFVDAGESARSASRPELQRMLAFLRANPGVRYVIVHKVDRLARNRVDDVEINLAIRQAGATLVSCTENIDETPSGMLLHGIMSSLAEFYSRNLASEVIKGTQQKVQNGGTPTLAPIGYINVRKVVDGREIRTVELDRERAELIRWAFEAYATGEWTLNSLTAELEARGLTQRPTARRAARVLPATKLNAVLRNRYYIGYVTWRGIEYEGKHPKLVSPAIFQRVQEVLINHRQSGERSYKHNPYLAGSLYCDRCKSRLSYGVSTGRRGDRYQHWFCMGRHKYKNGCDLPYLAAYRVEQAVVDQWQTEGLDAATVDELKIQLSADLQDYTRATRKERARLEERIHATKRERYRWADQAMDGSVPRDIAKEKQEHLASQLAALEGQLELLSVTETEHERGIGIALRMFTDCGEAYREGTEACRRAYNQAWFEGLFIDCDRDSTVSVAHAERTEIFEALRTAEVAQKRQGPTEVGGRGNIRYRVISRVKGSNVATLVGLEGLEPPTSRM